MYNLLFTETFSKQFLKLDKIDRNRISNKIMLLKKNPKLGQHMKGLSLWKLRVGEYRIIYSIEKEKLFIILLDIGHRKLVYRRY
ncbi:MAG: type II toxin-antitoxin system RelE/ParE family toxin [Nanoarchaeota archaeon]|nr:type II toxin-antitoxin system RelE/ParE family toxin [Nanoarchaeota archaeon]